MKVRMSKVMLSRMNLHLCYRVLKKTKRREKKSLEALNNSFRMSAPPSKNIQSKGTEKGKR